MGYRGNTQDLLIPVVNRGIGSAFNTKVFATVPSNVRFDVELLTGSRDISPLTDNPLTQEQTQFIIRGILRGIELKLELEYDDAEGYHYKNVIPTRTPTVVAE